MLVGNLGSVSAIKEQDSEDEDHKHTTSSVTSGSVSTISTIGSEDLGVTFGPTPTITCEIFKDITKFACTIQVLHDSGASINLMSESIFKKNRLPFSRINPEEYSIKDAQGANINITGKARVRMKFPNNHRFVIFETLLSDSLEDERLIVGWKQMMVWGILPKTFPSPPPTNHVISDNVTNNINESEEATIDNSGEANTIAHDKEVKEAQQFVPPPLPHWEEIDPTDKDYLTKFDAQCNVIKEYFLKNYAKAFTDYLEPEMYAYMEPVHITISEGATPVNKYTCRRLSQELEVEAEAYPRNNSCWYY